MLILTLYANALSCAVFGFLFLLLPTAVSEHLGEAPRVALMVIGAGLVVNAVLLVIEARRSNPRRGKVLRFVIGDAVWVLFSIALIVTHTWVTSRVGIVSTLAVALFVGTCGVLQFLYLPNRQKIPGQADAMASKRPKGRWAWVFGLPIAGISLVLVAVFGVHAIRQTIFVATEELPGKMVLVDGDELYVNCQGPSSARTIVLENGMGLASQNWDWIQRELIKSYHVCSYDRAGVGFSRAPKVMPNAGNSADSLAALLQEIEITEPVILVAHSYGGLVARIFADRYPEQAAGVVLVDSSHEDMGARFPPEFQAEFDKMLNGFSVLSMMNRFAGAYVIGITERFSAGLDQPTKSRAQHLYSSSRHMKGAAAEAEGWEISADLARDVGARGLGDMPLRVIMVDGWPDGMAPSWAEMQSDLSALSQDGSLTVIQGADHFNVLTNQAHADQISGAVRTLAEQVF
jgi:pimeloyl-ACP methyl ester carboxylesterase